MGRPKIKIMDESVEEKKTKKKPSKKEGRIEEVRGDSAGARSIGVAAANEMSEDAPRDTELAGPRVEKDKKPEKPGKAKPRRKKYQEITKDLDRSQGYSLT